MKTERCEICPDEHTSACDTCNPEQPEEMTLTYTFVIREGISEFDALHEKLDKVVEATGFGLVKSTMESPEEESEHEFGEGAEEG